MLCPFRGDTIPYSIPERKSNCGLRAVVSGSCPDKTNGQIAEWLRRSTFTFAKSRVTQGQGQVRFYAKIGKNAVHIYEQL